ncbi:MAG: hypothetical protein HZA93_07640 [Verrucomicrobia bacterium]|nr:hypothetical protein [Verrucomicrobiota bacterium]
MRPYLIEGLDCSGKKTIAAKVAQLLGEQCPCRVVIGPLSGGLTAIMDERLTHQTAAEKAHWYNAFTRRLVYLAGPVADRFAVDFKSKCVVIKVSSHFRAWARAVIEGDNLMAFGYKASRLLHVHYSGAALLTTEFERRVMRHRLDFAAGRTTKDEHSRFFNHNRTMFQQWDEALEVMMRRELQHVTKYDTTHADPNLIAASIAKKIAATILV